MAIELKICPNPVFVIGRPGQEQRSWHGHWLSIINSGPRKSRSFCGTSSVAALEKNYQRGADSWLRKQGIEKAEFREYVGLGLNALMTSRSHGKRWVDHVPILTLMLPYLADMFPGASFLHVLRDGNGAVHSMMHYLDRFSPGGNKADIGQHQQAAWYSDFRKACNTWACYVNAALDFGVRHPSRFLTVENERLVADPAEGFQRIFRFLQVPEEEAPMNYFRSTRMNSSFPEGSAHHSTVQKTNEIWCGWTAEQQQTFMEEAEATLRRCGYPTAGRLADEMVSAGLTEPCHAASPGEDLQ